MGRIVDLCGEIAAEAEDGPEGLVLPAEVWERLRADWQGADIEDALALVRDSLLQGELVGAADGLSARRAEAVGGCVEPAAVDQAQRGGGVGAGPGRRRPALPRGDGPPRTPGGPPGGGPGGLPRRRAARPPRLRRAAAAPDGPRHRGRDGEGPQARVAARRERRGSRG